MSNVSGKAYALTVLSPIKDGHIAETAYSDWIRNRLITWDLDEDSPMAKVPNTYLCRYFVLDDVYSQSLTGTDFYDRFYAFWSIFSNKMRLAALPHEDHLKSKYLIFSSNFHGDLETYLAGMWRTAQTEVKEIWQYCYAFDLVNDEHSFIAYIKKCQRSANLFFVGSNDLPLQQQLRSLYLKQEFSKFAAQAQGLPPAQLQQAYLDFSKRVDLPNPNGPAWRPGQSSLT